ncbi:MAG: restriction endonuclease subunit S, partial [Bacteroidales bacterium]
GEQFELYGSGTTFKEISTNTFNNFSILSPPLSEQQSIADYLDTKCAQIDELSQIKRQKIDELKEYKKSLIFECVTGKREII